MTVSRQHRPRIQHPCRSSQWQVRTISSLLTILTFIALAALPVGAVASVPLEATPVPSKTQSQHTHADQHIVNVKARAEHEELEKYEAQALRKREETSTIEIVLSTEGSTAAATTTVVTSPLPSPFDGNLAANFQGNDGNGACPSFINSFLTNSTFKACYPFSLLVQGSQSFFEAEKSAVAMTQILQVSCNASVSECTLYLEGLAEQLIEDGVCLEDYEMENQVVVQAYNGLRAYQELYSVSCLKDPDKGGYCFTNAVTNYTTPSDTYLYLLPLNLSLPGSASPSCSWCVENTMDIYQSATADRTLPLADLYEDAAILINNVCGPDFVNETLPVATVEDAAATVLSDSTLAVAAVMLAVLFQQLG
ncbi:uncharacterized protein MKZ38_002159 [Zalerion maritima]|uniref:DUF7729 domain-containing protein n=1 Tax=Zalerion maritima TaxID=339359 RepID=A0AAD5WSN8_9PEZI|nr:uncharacterized protein MKZ38_002159 [Zalerion maritima]